MVSYLDSMDLIQDADLILFSGSTLFEELIKFRTRSDISHVGVVLRTHGRMAVIESLDHCGPTITPIDKYVSDRSIRLGWSRLRAEEFGVDRDRFIEGMLQGWGKEYASWWQFARSWGFCTKRIGDWLGCSVDTDPNRFFCSEYVAENLIYAGYDRSFIRKEFGQDIQPAEMSPAQLIRLPVFDYQGRLYVDEAA